MSAKNVSFFLDGSPKHETVCNLYVEVDQLTLVGGEEVGGVLQVPFLPLQGYPKKNKYTLHIWITIAGDGIWSSTGVEKSLKSKCLTSTSENKSYYLNDKLIIWVIKAYLWLVF